MWSPLSFFGKEMLFDTATPTHLHSAGLPPRCRGRAEPLEQRLHSLLTKPKIFIISEKKNVLVSVYPFFRPAAGPWRLLGAIL